MGIYVKMLVYLIMRSHKHGSRASFLSLMLDTTTKGIGKVDCYSIERYETVTQYIAKPSHVWYTIRYKIIVITESLIQTLYLNPRVPLLSLLLLVSNVSVVELVARMTSDRGAKELLAAVLPMVYKSKKKHTSQFTKFLQWLLQLLYYTILLVLHVAIFSYRMAENVVKIGILDVYSYID